MTDFVSDLLSLGSEQATQPKPEKSTFSKDGYFDWENTKHVQSKNIAVGAIFPPYASWLDERLTAAKSGKPFNMPFMLAHGLHAVGVGKANKVYVECRRTLLRENKVGDGYPLLSKEIIDGGEKCPICDACWDHIWPKVEEYSQEKNSPEYKAWKAAHRAACPQVKYLMNFLPMGTQKVLIFDLAKTAADQLAAIHYDKMQPDLLWPVSKPGVWMSSFVKIERQPQPDNTPTKYVAATCYQGYPLCPNQDGSFNGQAYAAFLQSVTDLRVEAKRCLPRDEASIQKALAALANVVPDKLGTHRAVVSRIDQATEGVQPSSLASAVPTAAPAPVASAPAPAPVAVTPVAPAMGFPPASAPAAQPTAPAPVATPTPVSAPPAAATSNPSQSSNDAIALLSSLLDPTKK